MLKPSSSLLWFVAVAVLVPAGSARAGDWPGWRGPHGDGTSDETGLLLHWSATENVRWKTAIPGTGHSSPAIWGDRVYLTTCREETKERILLCLDRNDGRLLWERVVLTAPLEKKHSLNSYASSTPATDGRHVWMTFLDNPHLRVYCYDMDGTKVWEQSPGEFHSVHGFSSPPVLYKNSVIVNGDQDAEAYVVALDQATGSERWRIDRPNRTRSYCPPLIVEAAGRTQMVMSGSKCVASYDPETGRQLWIIDGPTEQFVASLVYADNTLFLTGGFPTRNLLGIRPDGAGDVSKTHVLWHEKRGGGYVPSPIACGHWFFVVNDEGIASCLEPKTGKRQWFERLGKHHTASPVAADGYLYFPDDDGVTHVLKAGAKFDVVARNPLGEACYASPAVSRGHVFIRTVHHLWCLGP